MSGTQTFVHERALCESTTVGAGTRVWAFAHVLPGATIGADCNICDGVFVENDVVVGDRVTLKCGVQLWDGIRLEDDVFVGPNATFTNDPFPRSREHPEQFPQTLVRRGASIGANATLLPGIEVGENAMVGAGAVVTHSVPRNAVVVGNPARIVGYVGAGDHATAAGETVQVGTTGVHKTPVDGVTVHRFNEINDMRGSLSVGGFGTDVPFTPTRWFQVYGVPSSEIRGEHAHKECHQFLTCPAGSVTVVVDDGERRAQYVLDDPATGIYLPPMTWGVQYRYSPDAVLVVFASHPYDADDYIRDYDEFLREVAARR